MTSKRKPASSVARNGGGGVGGGGGGSAKKAKKGSAANTRPSSAATGASSKKAGSKKNAAGTGTVSGRARNSAAASSPAKSNGPTTGSAFTVSKCRQWFQLYQAPDRNDEIGPEGIERLCNDLNIDVFGVTALLLAFYLEEPQAGTFHYRNWEIAMFKLNVSSTEALKCKLSELNALLDDAEQLKEFYKYLFTFAKVAEQKSLDVDTAIELLGHFPSLPHSRKLTHFLQQRRPVKVINKDQWMSFLEFNSTVSECLKGYDEMGAWPVLLDEYVQWRKQTDSSLLPDSACLKEAGVASEE